MPLIIVLVQGEGIEPIFPPIMSRLHIPLCFPCIFKMVGSHRIELCPQAMLSHVQTTYTRNQLVHLVGFEPTTLGLHTTIAFATSYEFVVWTLS